MKTKTGMEKAHHRKPFIGRGTENRRKKLPFFP